MIVRAIGVEPGARAATQQAGGGPIAVLATEGTVRSGAYVRAIENLAKSGKPFGPGFPPTPMGANRRESMPMMGGGPRPYPDFGMQSCS